MAVLFAASSCKDSTGTNDAGTFTGTLSGAVSGKKSGPAYYESDVTSGGSFFSVFGWSSDDVMEFGFDRDFEGTVPAGDIGLPTVGTHQIGVGNGEFESIMYFGDAELYATSGTITISSSTEKEVKGSFNVTYASSAGGTATFVGTFHAAKCPDC